MSWTTSADLRDQLLRSWERGKILGSGITGETLFPLKLSLRAGHRVPSYGDT